jgi:hypothetical protein
MYRKVWKGIVLAALWQAGGHGAVGAAEDWPQHQRDHGAAPVPALTADQTTQCAGDPQVSMPLPKAPRGTTATFCNDSAINLAGDGAATPYPSTINVAGTGGVITDVAVRFRNVLHPNTSRLQLRLQHPNGQVVAINGSGFDAVDPPLPGALFSDWRYSDRAQIYAVFGDELSWTAPTDSHHYLPRNFATLDLPAPGPTATPRQLLTSLEGLSANGTWSLWAAQTTGVDPDPVGTIGDGWCLDITTAAASSDCYHTVEITGSLNAGDVQQAGRITRDGSPTLCGYPREALTLENNTAYRRDAHQLVNPSDHPVCVTATSDFTGCAGNQTMLVLYSNYNPAQPHLNVIGESGYSTIGRLTFSARLAANQPYTAVVHETDAGAGCPLYRIRLETNMCLPPPGGDRIFYNGFQFVIPIAGEAVAADTDHQRD